MYWYLQRPADTPPLKRRQQRANFLERCGSAGDSAASHGVVRFGIRASRPLGVSMAPALPLPQLEALRR